METAMTSPITIYNKTTNRPGFTLTELIIVLTIIAVMVVIIMSHTNRSRQGLTLREEASNMLWAIHYVIDLAKNSNRSTRIVIDPKENTYALQIATEATDQNYQAVEGFLGLPHRFDPSVRIMNTTGFEATAGKEYLVFDPRYPWPEAFVSLVNNEKAMVIRIRGRQVEVDDANIDG
jgi:prepilin-type N-terminal cleavage/methylation domain-containing protein